MNSNTLRAGFIVSWIILGLGSTAFSYDYTNCLKYAKDNLDLEGFVKDSIKIEPSESQVSMNDSRGKVMNASMVAQQSGTMQFYKTLTSELTWSSDGGHNYIWDHVKTLKFFYDHSDPIKLTSVQIQDQTIGLRNSTSKDDPSAGNTSSKTIVFTFPDGKTCVPQRTVDAYRPGNNGKQNEVTPFDLETCRELTDLYSKQPDLTFCAEVSNKMILGKRDPNGGGSEVIPATLTGPDDLNWSPNYTYLQNGNRLFLTPALHNQMLRR